MRVNVAETVGPARVRMSSVRSERLGGLAHFNVEAG